jgi:hypothetical protein
MDTQLGKIYLPAVAQYFTSNMTPITGSAAGVATTREEEEEHVDTKLVQKG